MTTTLESEFYWRWVIGLATFSGLGSLFIIVVILWKLRREFPSRLIMYLSIADFGLSTICLGLCAYNLYNDHLPEADSPMCQVQGVLTWFFMESSILWLDVISIYSYRYVISMYKITTRDEIITNMFCWGVPFITSTMPIITGTGESYGPMNGAVCSFAQDRKEAQLINIMTYYVPSLLIITSCYGSMMFHLYGFGRESATNKDLAARARAKAIKKLFFYVLAYFIVWTPISMSYIYEYVTGQWVSFLDEFIVDQLLHVQGIINWTLYGFFNMKILLVIRNGFMELKRTYSETRIGDKTTKASHNGQDTQDLP